MDIRRIVELSGLGTSIASTLKDLDDGSTVWSVKDTFDVTPGSRQPVWAQNARRYGGARAVAESHGNAAITFRSLIKGSSVNNALLLADQVLSVLEQPRPDLYFQWQPDGATNSTFYEIRGPASYKPTYRWAQMAAGKSWEFEITIPVGPLARGLTDTVTLGTPTLPTTVQLGTAIGGTAPAQMDVMTTQAATTAAPVWAMIAWNPRPLTPKSSTVAPFGIIEAETGTSLSGWAAIGTDATYRGSNGIRVTTSGSGTALAEYATDPGALVTPDDFSSTIDLEVWARYQIASTVVSPTLTISAVSLTSSAQTVNRIYSAEYGSAGKRVVVPSSGSAFRFTRLGVLTAPFVRESTSTLRPTFTIRVAGSWASGSTGNFGLDYLVVVPARRRAVMATGKPNDATYPDFMTATSSGFWRKVFSDLLISAADRRGDATGSMGGAVIEPDPGNTDVFLKWSSLVPDDPTSDTTTEQLAHTLIATSQVYVTPRYFVARGA